MDNDKYTQIGDFAGEFSDNKFADKVARFAKKAGIKTIYAALILYYALFDKNFPPAQRTLIIGALGYFVFPIDLIPDAIPLLGYTDDFAALLYAVKTVWEHITPEIKEKAHRKMKSIFKNVRNEELVLF